MFTTAMIDVAKELGLPCYLFWASPATFLGLMIDLPILDRQLTTAEFTDSEAELSVRGFANSDPMRVPPTVVLNGGEGHSWFLNNARRYKETKGIVLNTFQELDPLCSTRDLDLPRVYTIGPVLDLNRPAQ
ncbi:UDP-glucuronosyl/UDP-glucosyltransferase [Parasponia andersonii]|uniref:UDP-glucuronosyl/UDP-glucosyltransferase n=1 Tax=Parasponia andersonii TaxID=3476 RepID=A0A2P5B0E8_PARAD|nr:UDP-glucuronosyl/UDP-glucosyltransferase [Parasponia andersonii]